MKSVFALEAQRQLGMRLVSEGRYAEAVIALQVVAALDQGGGGVLAPLGYALRMLGRATEAGECYRRAAAMSPGSLEACSNYLFSQHYVPGVDNARMREVSQAAARLPAPGQISLDRPRPAGDGRLRVGLISPDLGLHPVGFLAWGFLRCYDRSALRLTVYSNRRRQDDPLTTAFRALTDEWTHIVDMDDDAVARRVADDGVDVLIDLAGHTVGARLGVLMRRPAPVQMHWAGYVGTLGLDCVDYLIADHRHLPAGEEKWIKEAVIRLPGGYVCYTPPPYAPPVAPPPFLRRGKITFGSFNNSAKISPDCLALWGMALRATPGSELLLKSHAFGDAGVCEEFRRQLSAQGVAPDRIRFEGGGDHVALLTAYNEIDIALDTLPYSGGVTTCEALWMGVPVVAFPGAAFAGRHAYAHLTAAGVTETAADGPSAYVAAAVALAHNPAALERLRGTLRPRLAASDLCDAAGFTAAFQAALQWAWRRRRDGLPPASLDVTRS